MVMAFKMMTKRSLSVLRDIQKRTKGWPCGVPSDDRIAKSLVVKGYLRFAPPMWNYPKNPKTYGLTTFGELLISKS